MQNQNLINVIFKIILFLLCLNNFFSAEIEYADYNSVTNKAIYTHTNGDRVQTIELRYDSIPSYMKVTVTPGENTITPLVCVSNSDSNCKKDRIAFGSHGVGDSTSVYLRREQIDYEDKNLFVLVTCEEEKCSYSVKFEGGEAAEIDVNSVFSYVVSNENKIMNFNVMGNAEGGSYLTIGVEGCFTTDIIVYDGDSIADIETYKLDNGKILTFPLNNIENSNILANFQIKCSNIGDYLTLNLHTVTNGEAPDNLLYPNGPSIMGLLSINEEYKEECFPISAFESDKYSNVKKYYLTGKIYSKYGLFYLVDKDGKYMEDEEQEISDGLLSFLIKNNGEKISVCFEFSYEPTVSMGYVAYSISILETTKLESIYNFYPPQTIGQFYRRMIPKGEYAVYHSSKIDSSDKRLTFNMYNRKGEAEMYVANCSTYPNCTYTSDSIQNLEKPKRINRMTMWDLNIDRKYNALDNDKQVMIVYCKDDNNENEGYCEVDTLFNLVGNKITLVENEKFSKFVLGNEKGELRLDFKGGIEIERLTIDIMIYSGDVTFDIIDFNENENSFISYNKYFLSNKIVYDLNLAKIPFEDISIQYNAIANSFFTIKYEIDSFYSIQLEEKILSGENYLVQIDPTSSKKLKTIYLQNYRIKEQKPFLVKFNALNCEFRVKRDEEEIYYFDGFFQDILSKYTKGYNSEMYEYKINITKPYLPNYNGEMCMIYVEGYESPDSKYQTEIVVSETINEKVYFDYYFKSIRFLYPHSNPEKDLAVYVNIIDEAYFQIKMYINSEVTPFKEYNITKSQMYFLSGNEIIKHCPNNTLCSLIVEVTFIKSLANKPSNESPMIEITIRQIKNFPTYLKKNQLKKDFTYRDNFYYLYTDIGKNEIG